MNNTLLTPERTSYLKELFPELSETQVLCLFYYSLGFPSKRISRLMKCNAQTVQNNLQKSKDFLYLDKVSDLKTVFLIRLLFLTNH
ncbi:hypothetical protein F0243_24895 [Vibrio mediterranei]|nr:hypothetical protein [Vibrio mediterranei]